MPETVRDALREDLEWYACRGAYFHTDAHYGDVLFGAWCIDGPPREIVFSRAGIRVAARVGDWAIFDPFEPHAVLAQGESSYLRETYANAAPSHFVGFELALSESVRGAFGIEEAPATAARLSSDVAVNAQTGRFDAIGRA